MRYFIKNASLLLLLIGLSGCLYMDFDSKIISNEAVRTRVKFDSAQTAQIFELLAKPPKLSKYKGAYSEQRGVMIPFILFIDRRTFHETDYYNSIVRMVDTNGDHYITEEEIKSLVSKNKK